MTIEFDDDQVREMEKQLDDSMYELRGYRHDYEHFTRAEIIAEFESQFGADGIAQILEEFP